MSTETKEKGLEQHITDYLVSANGYVLRTSQDYDNVNCVDTDSLFQFLEKTQYKGRWQKSMYKINVLQ